MSRFLLRMCTILVALALSAHGLMAAEESDPFDAESFTAAATGLMILQFSPEAQAMTLGLKVGDIITSYAGKAQTTQAGLIAAVKDNTAEVPVVVRRGDQTLTVTAKPGKLGVYLEAVAAGTTRSLPPDTHVAFVTDRLLTAPIDTWYAFVIAGTKVGAEHAHLQRTGDRLTVTIEVMFDGGKRWGLNHMVETGVLDVATPVPRVVTQVHESPLSGFRSAGRWKDATTWELTVDGRNDDGTPLHEVETSMPTGPLINDYSYSYLASVMPTTPGACHHTRTVVLNSAKPSILSALLVVGPEEVSVDGQQLTAVRMEQRSLHGSAWIAWVKDGEIVKHDYSGDGKGGTIAYRTTQVKALAGLDPKLVPRTVR